MENREKGDSYAVTNRSNSLVRERMFKDVCGFLTMIIPRPLSDPLSRRSFVTFQTLWPGLQKISRK